MTPKALVYVRDEHGKRVVVMIPSKYFAHYDEESGEYTPNWEQLRIDGFDVLVHVEASSKVEMMIKRWSGDHAYIEAWPASR